MLQLGWRGWNDTDKSRGAGDERCSARTHATVRGHVGDLIAISFGLRSVLTLCSSCKLFVEPIDLTSKVTAAADLVQLRKL